MGKPDWTQDRYGLCVIESKRKTMTNLHRENEDRINHTRNTQKSDCPNTSSCIV